jgi:hypothetical protein
MRKELVAPCGNNCHICVAHFGYTMKGEKRKMDCEGCRPRDKSCAFLKKHCEKLTKKKVEYCYECDEFPCDHLQKLDKDYQEKYGISVVENLICIKEWGVDAFLKQQEKRYSCPVCGHYICVHTRICYSCQETQKNR